MRLASFNVENMFKRPVLMNQDSWEDGKKGLDDYHALNNLIQKPVYTAADKAKILSIAGQYPGLLKNKTSAEIRLREVRGKLWKLPKGKPAEIAVNGRKDWIGWFELVTEEVEETATINTARVFHEVKADVIAVIEAEDRIALKKFNEQVLPSVGAKPYGHVMLIDGNDDRGIDVGLMSRSEYGIHSMCSHVEDRVDGNRVFSRDCAEYFIILPSGETLLLLVNHLKSKGYGSQAGNDKKRKAQATRIRQLYDARKAEGITYIAVLGDFNDTPDRDPLTPLLGDGELKDFSAHPNFKNDGRPGTYRNGTASGKLDYILLSPDLFAQVKDGGVMRKGVWGGKNGNLWPHFDTMTSAIDAASDHAAVWVDLAI